MAVPPDVEGIAFASTIGDEVCKPVSSFRPSSFPSFSSSLTSNLRNFMAFQA